MRGGVAGIVTGLTLSLLAPGCAAPDRVVYSQINRPGRALQRRSPESVDVYLGQAPSRRHEEVGLFEVYQGQSLDGRGHSTEDMFRTLRLHAALRGCEAVQLLNVELPGKIPSRVVRAVCDIYVDEEGRRAADVLPPPPPLPGEKASCMPPGSQQSLAPCLDPLVCEDRQCVSPYR